MNLEEETRIAAARRLSAHATIRIVDDGSGPASAVVTGELDLCCVDALTAVLFDAVDAHPIGLRLDMSQVEFCGCSVLRTLLSARAFADALGRTFAVGPHSEVVARLLELSGARSLLTELSRVAAADRSAPT